jgi:hypothetical protein
MLPPLQFLQRLFLRPVSGSNLTRSLPCHFIAGHDDDCKPRDCVYDGKRWPTYYSPQAPTQLGRVTHISSNAHFLRSVCCSPGIFGVSPSVRLCHGETEGYTHELLLTARVFARSLESACTSPINRWKLLLCCWHLCYLRTKM